MPVEGMLARLMRQRGAIAAWFRPPDDDALIVLLLMLISFALGAIAGG